jgi:two-component system, NtrC family, sensor kinase
VKIKSLKNKLKPRFWDEANHPDQPGLFNYRRIWKLTVLCVSFVSITPLVVLSFMDYNLSRKAMRAEASFPIQRLVSNTTLNVGTFLQEKTSILNFIVHNNEYEDLKKSEYLMNLLFDINGAFGGFADLGVIGSSGVQTSYAGPFDFEGKDYSGQEWFNEVLKKDIYISDVFRGYRDEPHFVIALKKYLAGGGWFILRATIDTEEFNRLIRSLNVRPSSDVFLINRYGILQTPSAFHGDVLEMVKIDLPTLDSDSFALETTDFNDFRKLLECGSADSSIPEITESKESQKFLGCASINNSPFFVMVIKSQKELMQNWWKMRMELTGFMIISIASILLVILVTVTYLVSRIHDADIKRASALHKIEHTNKMASIGRLAAGVAHEINNPLAVINEKAGLLKDLFTYSEKYSKDEKLDRIADSIIHSVQRCSAITRRLLGFARHVDVVWQKIRVDNVIKDVLGFLDKEAQYREIEVNLETEGDIPEVVSDQGQLEQVFLNIINNAFAAVEDKGKIDILISSYPEHIQVRVVDNGCGIPPENLKQIFEPFFTTKGEQGTGLGLSITYGLVKKLGGDLSVESELGKGSAFTVCLSRKFNPKGSPGLDCQA